MTTEDEIEEIEAMVRRNIETHGQHIWSVTVAEGDPPGSLAFCYTVGNHGRGLPELMITGPIASSFGPVLNMLSKIQRERGNGFEHGELVNLGGKYPVRILDAGDAGRTEWATYVGNYYDTEDFEVRQVLICDPNGRWPGDPECAEGFRAQLIVNNNIN